MVVIIKQPVPNQWASAYLRRRRYYLLYAQRWRSPRVHLFQKEIVMGFYILPLIILLLVSAYLIYRGYAARARGRKTPDQET